MSYFILGIISKNLTVDNMNKTGLYIYIYIYIYIYTRIWLCVDYSTVVVINVVYILKKIMKKHNIQIIW